jgi:NitT/TauT family transport system substrate-binding protein
MRLAGVLAVLTVAFLGGCGKRGEVAPSTPLRVGIDFWSGYFPVVLAEDLGFFAEEGVKVELITPQNTDKLLAGFAAGNLDLVAVALGDLINLAHADRGVTLIAVTDESAGADMIIGRTPAPADPAAFRGMRLGTNLSGFGELLIQSFAVERGFRFADLQLVNMDAAGAAGPLKAGQVDAVHTWEPYASALLAEGNHVWFTSARTPGLIPDGFGANRRVTSTRGPEVRAFLRAFFRAQEYWIKNPAEGSARIEKRLGLAPGNVSLKGIRMIDPATNRALFESESPGGLRAVTARYVAFFIERGTLVRPVDPDAFLDPSLLP